MMFLLKLAAKNLLRNRRRTLSTVFSIVTGVAMMVFINGFNAGLASQWGNFIINQSEGHIRIQHREFYKYGITDKEKIYIADPENLERRLRSTQHVKSVMQRVAIAGLVGKGDNSTTFYGYAEDLAALDQVLPEHGKKIVAGRPLSASDPRGAVLGKALARSLNVKVGDELVILSNTVFGEQSSTLVTVRGLIEMRDDPKAEQNALLCGLGKEIRNDLLDLNPGATELVVRLDDTQYVKAVSAQLNQQFTQAHEPWVAKPWDDDKMFVRITTIFKGMGVVVMIIFSILIVIIIATAMMMTIFERLPEIGSMRAVGMEQSQVYLLFYGEAILMTLLGNLLGLALGAGFILLGNHVGISLGGGMFAGVKPVLEMSNVLASMLAPLASVLVAVWIPIDSACSLSVVESLTHN